MGIPSSTAVLVKSSRRDDPNPDRCNELPVEPASASEYWSLHADPVAITSGPRGAFPEVSPGVVVIDWGPGDYVYFRFDDARMDFGAGFWR